MPPVVALPPAPEGGPLDFRIQVFDTSFNVRSSILKNFPYFSKSFKEKEGKANQGAVGGQSVTGIMYFWHSEIMGREIEAREGKWASPRKWKLVEKEATKSNIDEFPKDRENIPAITTPFKNLTLAWSKKGYKIVNTKELLEITHLARSYGGLQTLSETILPAIRQHPEVISGIQGYPCDVLVAAAHLRQEYLFRDALMICLGPREDPKFRQLKDEKLREVATKAYQKLCQKMASFNQSFIKILDSEEITIVKRDREKIQERLTNATSDLLKRIENPTSVPLNENQPSAPSVYSEILKKEYTPEARKGLKGHLTAIEQLLSNQLLLANRQDPNGVFKNHFLNDSFQGALPWAK